VPSVVVGRQLPVDPHVVKHQPLRQPEVDDRSRPSTELAHSTKKQHPDVNLCGPHAKLLPNESAPPRPRNTLVEGYQTREEPSSGITRQLCGKAPLQGYWHYETHVDWAGAMFQLPNKRRWELQLEWLKNNPAHLIWSFGFEFTFCLGICPVAWALCVRRRSNNKVFLHSTIDYESRTLDQILDEYRRDHELHDRKRVL
jgi:hypothetical protein